MLKNRNIPQKNEEEREKMNKMIIYGWEDFKQFSLPSLNFPHEKLQNIDKYKREKAKNLLCH